MQHGRGNRTADQRRIGNAQQRNHFGSETFYFAYDGLDRVTNKFNNLSGAVCAICAKLNRLLARSIGCLSGEHLSHNLGLCSRNSLSISVIPEVLRFEFVAKDIRAWLKAVGVKTAFIGSGSR